MVERLLVLIAIGAVFALAVVVVQAWTRTRTSRLRSGPTTPLWAALQEQPDGRPTVVAFSTPSCAACRSAQAPALERLAAELGGHELRVLRVDASRQPDIARAFGVMTVPSTVVLDPHGSVAAVNHGFAPWHRLAEQVRTRA